MFMVSSLSTFLLLITTSFVGVEVNCEDPNGSIDSMLSTNDLLSFVVEEGDITYANTKKVEPQNTVILNEMLNDLKYEKYWPRIAAILSYVSTDANTVPALIEYFQRADYLNFTEKKMYQKIGACLTGVGRLGGNQGREFILKAINVEGAIELSQNWIDSDLIINNKVWYYAENRKYVIHLIRYSAIKSLALSSEQWANELLEHLYKDELDKYYDSGTWTDLAGTLAEAMVKRDFIRDYGIEEYERCIFTPLSKILIPYHNQYSPRFRTDSVMRYEIELHEYKSRIEKETLTVDDCRREEAKIAKWKSTVKKENLGEENIARLEGILDEILAEIQQKKAKLEPNQQ